MNIPGFQPSAPRSALSASRSGDVSPQGCSLPKKLVCGAAVAGCIATPNPVACILAVAPNCLDCL